MKKRLFSLLTSFVMVISLSCFLPDTIVKAETSSSTNLYYDNVDTYLADCISKGVTTPDVQSQIINDPMFSATIKSKQMYQILAEGLINNDSTLKSNQIWTTLDKALEGDIWESTTWQTTFYTVLLMDFMAYQGQTEEFQSDFYETSVLFATDTYGSLVDCIKDDIKYADTNDFFANATNAEAEEFAKVVGCWDVALKICEGIKFVADNAVEYFGYMNKVRALKKENTTRINFLKKLKEFGSDDIYLCAAVDNVVEIYESALERVDSFDDIENSIAYGKATEILAECAWSVAIEYVPLLETINIGQSGLNWLFNSDDISESNLKLVILYIMNSYATKAVQDARDDYFNNPTQKNAQILKDSYSCYLDYQKFATDCADTFLNELLFEGTKNKISNIFSDENINNYKDFKSNLEYDEYAANKTLNVINECYKVYNAYTDDNNNPLTGHIPRVFVESVEFDVSEYEVAMNHTPTITASTYPTYANIGTSITYSSSNTDVIEVDSVTGKITPIGEGTAYSIATSGNGKTDKCKVTVYPYEVEVGVKCEDSDWEAVGWKTDNVMRSCTDGFNQFLFEDVFFCHVVPDPSTGEITVTIPSNAGKGKYYISMATDEETLFYGGEEVAGYFDYIKYQDNESESTSDKLWVVKEAEDYIDNISEAGLGANVAVVNNNTTDKESNADPTFSGGKAVELSGNSSAVAIPFTIADDDNELKIHIGYDYGNLWPLKENGLYENGLWVNIYIPTNTKEYTITKFVGSKANITIPNSIQNVPVTCIGDEAFADCRDITSVIISNSVESIGNYAFTSCENLTNVNMADGLKNIGDYAFASCKSLSEIMIPNSVVSLGNGVFEDCTSLSEIRVSESNEQYVSENGILYNKDKTELLCYPANKEGESFIIPDGVAVIKSTAFYGCVNLKSIVIPATVTSIDGEAFSNLPEDFTIKCYPETVALEYAISHSINYELLDEDLEEGWVVIATYEDIPFDVDYSTDHILNYGDVSDYDKVKMVVKGDVSLFKCYLEAITGNGTDVAGEIALNSKFIHTFTLDQIMNTDRAVLQGKSGTITKARVYGYKDGVEKYKVKVFSNRLEWGTVSGIGRYKPGEAVTVKAMPKEGYRFVSWTDKNGNVVSTNATYTFVARTIDLYANFTEDLEAGWEIVSMFYEVPFAPDWSTDNTLVYGDVSNYDIVKLVVEGDIEMFKCYLEPVLGSGVDIAGEISVKDEFEYIFSTEHMDTIRAVLQGKSGTITKATVYGYKNDVCCGTPEGLMYNVNSFNEITITGYEGILTELEIPSTIDGKSVTCIAESAFSACTKLTSIIIPESITNIEDNAFSNNTRINCYTDSVAHKYAVDNNIRYKLLNASLPGDVYFQYKNDNTMIRFIAEVDIEDVTNANSGEITVFYNGDILEIKNITGAYKSLYAAGQVITAPEGKCYIISNQYTGFMYDDMMSVEYTLDNYDLGLSRDVIIE